MLMLCYITVLDAGIAWGNPLDCVFRLPFCSFFISFLSLLPSFFSLFWCPTAWEWISFFYSRHLCLLRLNIISTFLLFLSFIGMEFASQSCLLGDFLDGTGSGHALVFFSFPSSFSLFLHADIGSYICLL